MWGKKAASREEAREASWAVVHLEVRWRGRGGVVGLVVFGGGGGGEVGRGVVVGGMGMGRWMLGMGGCFGDVLWGFGGVVVVGGGGGEF